MRERICQLQDTGTALDEFAKNDPVGLLWHLGVLCIPHSTLAEQKSAHLADLHEAAQQAYSEQILEEHHTLDEPERAAIALLSWIRQRNLDGLWEDGPQTHKLASVLNSAMAEKPRSASPSVSGSCGTASGSETHPVSR